MSHAQAPYPPNAPSAPKNKPWRVTAHSIHWYWGTIEDCWVVGDYRWYWQANLSSFLWHHIGGFGCNTWKQNVIGEQV